MTKPNKLLAKARKELLAETRKERDELYKEWRTYPSVERALADIDYDVGAVGYITAEDIVRVNHRVEAAIRHIESKDTGRRQSARKKKAAVISGLQDIERIMLVADAGLLEDAIESIKDLRRYREQQKESDRSVWGIISALWNRR
jgi:hypothetical protein